MSHSMEYQYYEFQAIDRPLSKADQDYVRTLSSRVQPTTRRAILTYSYGSFRGEPLAVLEKCFDAMLSMANWGSYQLAFRFPKSVLDPAALAPYCLDNVVEVSTTEDYVILNIQVYEEEGRGGWIEDDNHWLSELIPLRQAILAGDYRVLYLAWLQAAAVSPYVDEDDPEPPVPPNLQTLNAPLQAFVQWLNINPDLITVAAQSSPTVAERQEPVQDWVNALSDGEKTQLLLEIVTGDSAIADQIRAQLRQRFAKSPKCPPTSPPQRRQYSELKMLADRQTAERKSQADAAAQAQRRQYLESLKPRQAELWDEIAALIARKQAQSYDQAVQHLIDLRDLAALEGTSASFQARMQKLRAEYANRPSLFRRLRAANL